MERGDTDGGEEEEQPVEARNQPEGRPEEVGSQKVGSQKVGHEEVHQAGGQQVQAGRRPKSAAKKPPAIKLSDAQARVLSAVSQTNEAGYVGTKAEGRILDALLKRKMVKKGKKEASGSSRFLVTKSGAKYVAAPAASSAPVSAPSAAPDAAAAPPPTV